MIKMMLLTWVLEFNALFGIKPTAKIRIVEQVKMTMIFDKALNKSRPAYAEYNPVGHIIFINANFWYSATDIQRKELIWHEWGHSALKLPDTEDPWEYSLMNKVVNVLRPDNKNWEELKTELYWRWRKSQRK